MINKINKLTNTITQAVKKHFTVVSISAYAFAGLLMFLPFLVPTAEATIPKYINFQGKLTKVSDGTNVVNGTYAFQFKLYDASTSGTLLWTETFDQPSGACSKLTVTNGVFNAKLGTCNSLSGVDFSTGSLYLSVNFAPTGTSYDGEMSPRKQLLSSAFAFVANGVNGDGTINIANTGSNQATIGYDSSNKLQVDVNSSGFTTFTANGSGSGFNLTGGNVGIGTSSLSAKLHVTATTEQLRLAYDGSNYSSFTTSSGGDLTIAPSGGDLAVTGNVDASGTLTAGTADAFQVNSSGTVTIASGQSYTGAGAVTVSSGGTNTQLTIDSAGTGTIAVGTDANAETINLGTGAAAKAVVLGSTNSTSTTTVQSGSGNIQLQSNGTGTGNIFVGDTTATTTPDLLVVGNKSNAGNPTGTNGAIYYNSSNKFMIYENGTWKEICNKTDAACGAGSGSAWSALTAPTGDLSLGMNENTTTFTWDTAATAAAKDYLTLAVTNDASTDSTTQRLLVLSNTNSTGSTPTENLLVLDNSDTDEAVTTGLQFTSAAGGITTAIDASDSDIGTALNVGSNDITGTTGNITFSNWNINGGSGAASFVGVNSNSGLIQGTGGATISGVTRVGNIAATPTYEETNYGSVVLGSVTSGSSTATSGSLYNSLHSITFTPSASSSANIWGLGGSVFLTGANDFTGQLVGVTGEAQSDSTASSVNSLIGGQFDAYNTSTATVDSLRGSVNTISIDDGTINNATALQAGGYNDGTLTNYRGLHVTDFNTSGSTTNDIGINLEDQDAGSNNTNLLIGTATAPSGNFSIYNSSTYDNYFAGNVGIKTATPSTFPLEVAGNIGPSASATYNLGSTSRRFESLFLDGELNFGSFGQITIPNNTSNALTVLNASSQQFLNIDTNLSSSGVTAFAFNHPITTIPSAAGAQYTTARITPSQYSFTGSTNITGTGTGSNTGLLIDQLSLQGTGGQTITESSDVLINGAVRASSGSPTATLTNSYALNILAGSALNASNGAVTNGYGLSVNAPTGAANNYAAVFQGGNVGIGTSAPASKLTVTDTNSIVGSYSSLSVSPTLSGGSSAINANQNGINVTSSVSGTFSAGLGGSYDVRALYGNSQFTGTAGSGTGNSFRQKGVEGSANFAGTASAGGDNVSVYGGYFSSTGNIGTTDTTKHIGVYTSVSGTADDNYGIYIENIIGATNNYALVTNGGNVGIGDTSPTALLTVGSGDLFQVNSSGAIAAATGISSSGTINFSGLSASSAVYTDGSKNLTSTAPTSGTIGYWSRSGTTLQPATGNDIVSIPTTNTSGADLAITNTGVYTGTGIFNLTANSATTGNLASITGNGLTTGNLLSLSSNGTAGLTNQTGLNISLQGALTGAQTTYGSKISNTHTGASAVNVGLYATASGATGANYAALFDQGNVGINTTTPQVKFEVAAGYLRMLDTGVAATAATSGNGLELTALNNIGYINAYNRTSSAYEALRINGNPIELNFDPTIGNVGIGTSAPDRQLEINSTTGSNLRLSYNDSDGLAANRADFLMSSSGDLTITPSGNDTNITGNLDVSGTIFAATSNAFQVSSTGAVTAVGVDSGTGLLQGTGGLTILGTTSINASGSSNTSIGATSNSGTIAIGNSSSTAVKIGKLTTNGPVYTSGGDGTLNSEAQLSVTRGGTGAGTLTGVLIGNGTSAVTGTTTSSGISGALSDETGSGALVFANTPTLVTPNIGAATGTSIALTSTTATGDANSLTDASFAPAAAASANLLNFNFTNVSTNGSGTSTVNGILLSPTQNVTSGAGAHQTNGINLGTVATNTCTGGGTCQKYAIYAPSSNNYTDLFNYNGTSVINATGQLNAAQLTGTVPSGSIVGAYGSLTGTGTLTSGSTGAGFTVALGTSTITGVLGGTNGGTGVNNGSNTITLGGNINTASSFTTSGANALTLTTTASTNVTLPTSGTLYGTATGSITSAQLAGSLSDETGSGLAVFGTNPTFSASATFSGLGTSSAVYTDGSSALTTTAPSSGTIGYWSRAGTILSPAAANDVVSIPTTNTTGADLAITNTGVYTGTGIVNVSAANTVAGTIVNIAASAASQTTTTALNVVQSNTTTGYTGNLVNFTGTSTTGAGNILGITTANTTAGAGLALTANGITTGFGASLSHATSSITTGALLQASSTVADGYTTGGLVKITSNAAFTTTANTAGLLNVAASGTTAGTVVNISSSAAAQTTSTLLNVVASGYTTGYTGNVASFTGVSTTGAANVVNITSANTTAGTALNVSTGATTTNGTGVKITANSLTTGTGLIIPHTTSVIASGGSLLRLSSTSADTSTTTGTLLDLQSSGSTAGTIALLTNNTAAFTGKSFAISSTGITTGKAIDVTLGSTLTTGAALNVSGASYNHGSATETGSLASLAFTDATNGTATSTTNGLLISPTVNVTTGASGTKTINGISIAPTFTACTGGSTCNPNGLNIGNVTDGTGITSAALNIGTGWDNALSVGGTSIVNGSGQINASQLLTGTVPSSVVSGSYTGITGVGTLTAGSTGSGFTIALGASTITGVLGGTNGGTGVNNGSNTITLGGNINTSGAFTTTGAFGTTFAQGATTTQTLPSVSSTLYGTGTGTITSSQLATSLSDETGTAGSVVFSVNPTLTGGATINGGLTLGTQLSVANGGTGATTLTGLLLGNGTSAVTGVTTSAGISGALSDETGTGTLVFNNSPSFFDDITLGSNGVANGAILLKGSVSGTITLQSSGAGTYDFDLPTTAGTSGFLLTSGGGATMTWTDPASLGVKWSSLQAPTSALSLTMPAGDETTFTVQSTTQTGFLWQSSTLTSGILSKLALTGTSAIATPSNSGSAFTISSTATGFTAATQTLSSVFSSGTNSNSGVTIQGFSSNVTNTGTSSTNIGGVFSASGGAANYALVTNGGNVGIGDSSPASLLTVGSGDLFQVNSSGAIAAVVGITNSGTLNTTVSSATALTVAKSGGGNAFVVDTSAVAGQTGVKVTSQAAGAAISTLSLDSDDFLSIDSLGTGELQLNGIATGDILLGGGAGSSGCTLTNSSGDFTCDGALSGSNFSGSSSGTNTGDVTLSAFGSSPNANGASLSGQALTLQPADGSNPGGVSTTGQTFGGTKTFNGGIVIASGQTITGASTANLALTTTTSGNITLAPASTGSVQLTSGVTTGTGTSSGLSLTSSTITSGTLFNLNQAASTFTGTGIKANFANATGSFSGNFIDMQVNGSSKFKVSSTGAITSASLGGGGTLCLQTDNSGNITAAAAACGAGSTSLQDAYNAGNTIETSTNPVVIQETSTGPFTHDLLDLTVNPAGNTFSGDALKITLDAVDAISDTGNGINIVVDKSQVTGSPLIIQDDSSNPLFQIDKNGNVGIQTAPDSTYPLKVNGGGLFSDVVLAPEFGLIGPNGFTGMIPDATDSAERIDFNVADLTALSIISNRNVGIGDSSPASLLTVGSGDLFQVNSFGSITAVVGITSSSNYVQSTGTMALTTNVTTGASGSSGFAIAAASLTSGTVLDITSNGTAALTNQTGLNISLQGVNATGSQTTYGAQISNTHGGSGTNYGLQVTASGGTNNFPLIVRYDSSNYYTTAVSSTGTVTYDANGTITGFIFNDNVSVPGAGTQSEQFGSAADSSGNKSTVVGYSSRSHSAAVESVAVGNGAETSNAGSIALGYSTLATADNSIVIGHDASVGSAGSIVFGEQATDSAANQFVAGSFSNPINNVFFGKGAINASATAYTIHGTGGNGSNIAGANLQLAGGQGTGTGNGGNLLMQVAYPTTTGSTANSLTTVANFLADNNDSSGTQNLITLSPTVNQSGTAGYTSLLVSTTETATGSGTKNLLDLQVVGGSPVSKFSVSNAGAVTSANLATGGANKCIEADTNGKLTLAASACGSGSGGITIGTTTITSGSSGRVLYDNAGVVGEMTTTGSGTVLALATTPTFTTNITTPLVNGSTSANGTLTIQGNNTTGNTSTNANLVFKVGDSAGTTAMTILNSGSVGIGLGTVTSGTKVEIAGNLGLKSGADAFVQTTDGNNLILRADSQSGTAGKGVLAQYWNGGSWVTGVSLTNVSSGTSNLLLMQNGGNVGIGASSPGQKLTVTDGVTYTNFSNMTPTTLSGFDFGANVTNVFVSGKYAYVTQATNAGTCSGTTVTGCEFSIFDIQNKSAITAVSGVDLAIGGEKVVVSGKYAYVTNDTVAGTCSGTTLTGCEFRVYDISNPSTPAAVSGLDIGDNVVGLNIQGRYAYVTTAADAGTCSSTTFTGCEFKIIDLVNQSIPSIVGGDEIGIATNTVYVAGKYAYIGNNAVAGTCSGATATGCEFRIYDISNKLGNPSYVSGSGFDFTTNVNSIVVSGKYAYFAQSNNTGTCSGTTVTGCEVGVLDISNPGTFTGVNGLSYGFDGKSVQISGKYIYAAVATDSSTVNDFKIIDASTPTAITNVGGVDLTTTGNTVFVSGKYAFVGMNNITGNDLRIYDIGGDDTPSLTVGDASTGALTVTDNARIDNSLYVGNSLNVGTGGADIQGPLTLNNSVLGSGAAAVAGINSDLTLNNSTSSGTQFGNRNINRITSTVAGTEIGQLIRVIDNTDCGAVGGTCTGGANAQFTQGLRVEAYSGSNVNGTNTAILGYGYTIGLYGETTAQAAADTQPAAVFAYLDNGTDSTTKTRGNAVRAYTNTATSATIVNIYQETSAYTGTALAIDLANNSGTFASGNFINATSGGTTKFKVDNNGDTSVHLALSTGNFTLCHDTNGAGVDVIRDCNPGPGSDYMELYSAEAGLEMGDVVAPSNTTVVTTQGDTVAKVTKTTAAYQGSIMGVISNPADQSDFNTIGHNLKPEDNPQPVALVGRVKVKVTTENGIIQPGDYLTSSATQPGYAMKATGPGMVIGQALDFFDGLTGNMVMVFVNPMVYDPTSKVNLVDNTLEMQRGSLSTQLFATTTDGAAYLVNQQGSGNVLQLQQDGMDKLLVQNNGSLSLNVTPVTDTELILAVKAGDSDKFTINARGDVNVSGVIVIKDDTFAGSVATLEDGTAEITFSYDLGTGKPVVQLTAEADVPVFAQILQFKQDDQQRYTGFVIKTFGLDGSPVSAVVHYNVTGKEDGYVTYGQTVNVISAPQNSGSNPIIIQDGHILGGADPINPDDVTGVIPNDPTDTSTTPDTSTSPDTSSTDTSAPTDTPSASDTAPLSVAN